MVCGIQEIVRTLLEQGEDPTAVVLAHAAAHPETIYLCDEVGCGVVPVDPGQRAWREAVGRCCVALAGASGPGRTHLLRPAHGAQAMLRLVLLRHGEAEGNRERRFLGLTDAPLTQVGETQAAEAAQKIPAVEHVYVSPLCRCRQTAGLVWPRCGADGGG